MIRLFSIAALALFATLLPMLVAAHGNGEHAVQPNTPYTAKSTGTRLLGLGDVQIKMLLDAANAPDSGLEVAELIIPAAYKEGQAHAHGSLEIFYVVEGILGHEVNGTLYKLNPGELGFVKPGDEIKHHVLSEQDVKAVVIWTPGGEASRLVEHAGFKELPLGVE
ncbi:MAG: cupin domain-containing protein [Pseudomonadota bacterium]